MRHSTLLPLTEKMMIHTFRAVMTLYLRLFVSHAVAAEGSTANGSAAGPSPSVAAVSGGQDSSADVLLRQRIEALVVAQPVMLFMKGTLHHHHHYYRFLRKNESVNYTVSSW